ncbi:MAG TPA: prepilin-type N-terminal cleavage/methylation domain-containing protein [Mycobacteriales bacterium]|nr:prepilin-type N-terminal cleavage/methylation domain-containing protein [Mycobacteriales bacterium]
MLARIRKAKEEGEGGFTLIELLVVIIIIGILAAIAIPVFLNQRKKAWDAAVKSDLRNAATAEETYNTDQGYYTALSGDLINDGFKFSAAGNYTGAPAFVFSLYNASGATATGTAATGSFCLTATSASSHVWVYDSGNGGLQPSSVTGCPATD